MSDKKILTLGEAAALLHCSEYTMGEHCRSGKYPAVKVGRSWVLPYDLLMSRVEELARTPRVRTGLPVHLMPVPRLRSQTIAFEGATA